VSEWLTRGGLPRKERKQRLPSPFLPFELRAQLFRPKGGVEKEKGEKGEEKEKHKKKGGALTGGESSFLLLDPCQVQILPPLISEIFPPLIDIRRKGRSCGMVNNVIGITSYFEKGIWAWFSCGMTFQGKTTTAREPHKKKYQLSLRGWRAKENSKQPKLCPHSWHGRAVVINSIEKTVGTNIVDGYHRDDDGRGCCMRLSPNLSQG